MSFLFFSHKIPRPFISMKIFIFMFCWPSKKLSTLIFCGSRTSNLNFSSLSLLHLTLFFLLQIAFLPNRGIIPIEILRELEKQSGQPIHQMFDYVIGVSSGAVLVYLLAYAKASLDTCEQLFKEFSVDVFQRNTLLGTSKLFFSHAFYDTDAWMAILKWVFPCENFCRFW